MSSITQRVVWFIYAISITYWATIPFVQNLQPSTLRWEYLNLVALIGFWGYVLGVNLGPRLVWKVVFVLNLGYIVVSVVRSFVTYADTIPKGAHVLVMLGFSLFLVPYFYALWRYSFGALSRDGHNKSFIEKL